jgi:hypothetical protein
MPYSREDPVLAKGPRSFQKIAKVLASKSAFAKEVKIPDVKCDGQLVGLGVALACVLAMLATLVVVVMVVPIVLMVSVVVLWVVLAVIVSCSIGLQPRTVWKQQHVNLLRAGSASR